MKLIYFTNSYPYGVGELWKTDELKVLVNYFDNILVVPFSYEGQKNPVEFISGVNYETPIFPYGIKGHRWYSKERLMFFFSKDILTYFLEFWQQQVFLSKFKFKAWWNASYKMSQIKRNKAFRNIVSKSDKQTILYFYWGRGTSEILPVLNVENYKIISRFHRYDLYREANGGYIPYQLQQVKKVSYALPCSDDGRMNLIEYYPKYESKILTKRLGTLSRGKSTQNKSGIFTIVSCSFVEKVKRVDIIANALEHINEEVHWIHIGDGSCLDTIKTICNEFNSNIKVTFLGKLKNEEVIDFYVNNSIDLFLNVSESEGVPVSIMEALAAAIPVYATGVGGTGEIINSKNGKLLSKFVTPEILADEIQFFMKLEFEEKEIYKANAYNTYLDFCNADKLARDFASFLLM